MSGFEKATLKCEWKALSAPSARHILRQHIRGYRLISFFRYIFGSGVQSFLEARRVDTRGTTAGPDPARVVNLDDLVRELNLLRSRAARGTRSARVSLEELANRVDEPNRPSTPT